MCKHQFTEDSWQPVCIHCGELARQRCKVCNRPMEAKLGPCYQCEAELDKSNER